MIRNSSSLLSAFACTTVIACYVLTLPATLRAQFCATECDLGKAFYKKREEALKEVIASRTVRMSDGSTGTVRAVYLVPVLWEPGTTLGVLFLNSSFHEKPHNN